MVWVKKQGKEYEYNVELTGDNVMNALRTFASSKFVPKEPVKYYPKYCMGRPLRPKKKTTKKKTTKTKVTKTNGEGRTNLTGTRGDRD